MSAVTLGAMRTEGYRAQQAAPLPESTHLIPPERAARARPRERWGFAFGPRFYVLLLVGMVWLGPAWWERRFLLAMAIWDLLALLAWAWDLRRLPHPEEMDVRRVWVAPVALETVSTVRLEVRNLGRAGIHAVLVDDVPATLCKEPPTVEISCPGVQEGPAGRRADWCAAEYCILPVERGDSRIGDVFLRYQSAFRLAERWATAQLAQAVRVYPNLQEAKSHTIYLIRSRQIELEKRRRRQRGAGREFESLREFRDGDEWRDIFWPGTARRGKLITKVYQIERSQAVWIVVDAGRLLRARVGQLAKLDYAVNAALSLAHVALYSGDRVGLLAYGRKLQQRSAPGRGHSHLRTIVEQLAQVRGEAYEADHLRAAHVLLSMQKRRSLVVWLTDLAETAATPDVIESAMQMTSRHLLLFVVMGQPELTKLATTRPRDVEGMYEYVAAQEMVQRRELLLRGLRQRGALAVEVEPGRLSTALVNHYLDIKERSLL